MKTVRLLVGTTKGVFFLRAPAARTAWQVEGPHLPGRAIYSLAYDGREGRQRVWAGAVDPVNLVGVLLQGERVPAHSGRGVLFVDGLPQAAEDVAAKPPVATKLLAGST